MRAKLRIGHQVDEMNVRHATASADEIGRQIIDEGDGTLPAFAHLGEEGPFGAIGRDHRSAQFGLVQEAPAAQPGEHLMIELANVAVLLGSQ